MQKKVARRQGQESNLRPHVWTPPTLTSQLTLCLVILRRIKFIYQLRKLDQKTHLKSESELRVPVFHTSSARDLRRLRRPLPYPPCCRRPLHCPAGCWHSLPYPPGCQRPLPCPPGCLRHLSPPSLSSRLPDRPTTATSSRL
jgi:hypothetical protein